MNNPYDLGEEAERRRSQRSTHDPCRFEHEEIDRLKAENEKLKGLLHYGQVYSFDMTYEGLEAAYSAAMARVQTLEEEAADLKTENAKLRGLLRRVLAWHHVETVDEGLYEIVPEIEEALK